MTTTTTLPRGRIGFGMSHARVREAGPRPRKPQVGPNNRQKTLERPRVRRPDLGTTSVTLCYALAAGDHEAGRLLARRLRRMMGFTWRSP